MENDPVNDLLNALRYISEECPNIAMAVDTAKSALKRHERWAQNRSPEPPKDLCVCGHPRADHRQAIGYKFCGHTRCACTGIG